MTASKSSAPAVLVTGASGKVGRAVLPRLVAAGYAVRATSSKDVRAARGRVRWLRCDLTAVDDGRLREIVQGCAAVVHLAVEQRDEARMEELNVRATARLAAAAEQEGVRVFCFTSSIAVYGSTLGRIAKESSPLIDGHHDRPEQYWVHDSLRAYARSKVRAEAALRAGAERMHYVVLRPSVIVDDDDLRISASVSAVQRAAAWNQATHHVPLDAVADAIVWAVDRGRASVLPRVETFNATDPADGGRYRDLFEAAGVGRGTVHRLPLPGVPLAPLRAMKWLRAGHPLPARRPMGASSFPSDELRTAGFTTPVDMAAARQRAFAGPDRPSASESAGDLALAEPDHRRSSSSSSI